jgi:hypothetical protein
MEEHVFGALAPPLDTLTECVTTRDPGLIPFDPG